jgi:hypothetical protein
MRTMMMRSVGSCALAATVFTWGWPGVSMGEDFFDKMKRAAQEATQRQQQRQQQQQQQRQSQQRQQPLPQRQPQAQQPRHQQAPSQQAAQQQPQYKPGGGTRPLPDVKPEPSPDFGTPEGTAKIAARAGFLDVVGIKPGMPVKEAVDALKAHNAGFNPGPITLREYEALPGVVMTPVLYAPNPGGPNATSGDDFRLLLTYAPNEAFVWGIVRNMGFGRVEDRPTVENTLAGVRQKYGQESVKEGDSLLIWIYDGEGKQVMGQQAKDIRQQCSATWVNAGGSIAGNNPDRNNQYSNSYFDQQLKGGYYYGAGRMGSPGGVCHTHSKLSVGYMHAVPAGSTADLMMGMVIGLFNHQLEASGVTASHTNLMTAVGKLNEKRGEEENKRGGMEF